MSDSEAKPKSAAELYKEHPEWDLADIWEYRMRTMSPEERRTYNQDHLELSGFFDAAVEAFGAGSAKRDDMAKRMHAVVSKFFGD